MSESPSRHELVKLAKRIQDAQDGGREIGSLVSMLQRHVPYPNVADLFSADYSAELIVDYAKGWRKEWPQVTKSELLELVERIMEADGSEAEIKLLIDHFDAVCLHPAKHSLIYYPDEHFDGNPTPTAEQIVEKAITGKQRGLG